MIKEMKKKKFVLFLLVFFGLTLPSCSIFQATSKYNKKIESIGLNMTKEEVVAIMGTKYTTLNLTQTEDGVLSTICYNDNEVFSIYYLYFINNHLVEWVREYQQETADRVNASRAAWMREQDRKKEFDDMKKLKEREVEALEKANKKKN